MAISSPSVVDHLRSLAIPANFLWLVVLLPALSYFISSRWPSFAATVLLVDAPHQHYRDFLDNPPSVTLVGSKSCTEFSQQFSVSCSSISTTAAPTTANVELLMTISSSSSSSSTNLNEKQPSQDSLQSSIWLHDAELGRGFLLVAAANRLWRWERGGGPIPIGRTLQMDHAGCRPEHEYCLNNLNQNHVGGMTVDFMDSVGTKEAMAFLTGQLILAEWGEGRIVRLEDNGARTPLALLATRSDQNRAAAAQGTEARHLLMTPFGDLLYEKDHTIQMIPQAMTIAPLESLAESRLAHNHTWIIYHERIPKPHVFWQAPSTGASVDGMALSESWNLFYASVTGPNGRAQLYRISLADENEDSDDEEESNDVDTNDRDESINAKKSPPLPDSQLMLDLTEQIPSLTRAGPIAVTKSGFIYWVVNQVNLVILQPKGDDGSSMSSFTILGYMTMPETITSLTVGGIEDSHLYLTTEQSVWKWPTKVPTHPVAVPTNLAPTHRAKGHLPVAASE